MAEPAPHIHGVARTAPIRLGIIAGGGSLPLEIARSVTARGGYVHIVMIEGEAENALRSFSHDVLNWAQLGRAIKSFKRAGLDEIVLVGSMSRPSFRTAKPDFGFFRSLPQILRALRAGGDDAVLRGVVALFESRRLRVVSVGDIAPELLLSEGPLSFQRPSAADEVDIAKGFALVGALGPFDIGQAVIVAGGVIEAIEGAEGTDAMIERVREKRAAGGIDLTRVRRGVLVKRPKPGQDLRLDLPAIGPETVTCAADAGLSGIAGLSGEVLAASRFEMIARADRSRLFVAGIRSAAPQDDRDFSPVDPIILSQGGIPPAAEYDVTLGVYIMSELSRFVTGSALVIANGRVLAVGAEEPPSEVFERASMFMGKKRRGHAIGVLGPLSALDEALVKQAAELGLQGLILTFGSLEGPPHTGAVLDIADKKKMFVAGVPMTAPKVLT